MLQGEDYDRIKLLHIEAIEAERLDRKKKKKNPDPGFADYEQATARCGVVVLAVVPCATLSNFSSWCGFLVTEREMHICLRPTDTRISFHY